MTNVRSPATILWSQVWGLAAVQGAITLMWVIYNLYLVQLLTSLGFPQSLAASLLIIENLLAIVIEPLMGSFSDQLQHRVGTRFPLISLGVILAAGCFVGIPTVLLWGQRPFLRWLLPLLMVAWAIAMTVFRSPALSLLGRYAFRTQLPQAASILTLVGGLAGAIGPLANQFVLGLGAIAAFTISSGVLLLATAVLSWVGPDATTPSSVVNPPLSLPAKALPWKGLAFVFGAGVGVTLGFRLMMTMFPQVLRAQVPEANPALALGTIFIALALAALPAGRVAAQLGNRRTMIGGLAIMACLVVVMATVGSVAFSLVLAALLGGAFTLVSNGTIPFALSVAPANKAGLGTGIYFSGGALASSLFGALGAGSGLSPRLGAILGALSFLLAGICVAAAQEKQ